MHKGKNEEFKLYNLDVHPLTRLSPEIWTMINRYLSANDRLQLLATDRNFYRIFSGLMERSFKQERSVDFQITGASGGIIGFLLTDRGQVYSYSRVVTAKTSRGISLHTTTSVSHNTECYTKQVPNLPRCVSIAFSQHHDWGFAVGENGDVFLVSADVRNILVRKIDRLSGIGIKKISLSDSHALALTTDGEVMASGHYKPDSDVPWTIPRNNTIDVLTEFEYCPNAPRAKAIATGLEHSVILTTDGKVYTLVNYLYCAQASQYKYNSQNRNHFQENILYWDIQAIACGDAHTVLLDKNGNVYGAGYGYAMGQKEKNICAFTKLTELKADSIHAADCITVINASDGHSYYMGIQDNDAIFEAYSAFELKKFPSDKPVRVLYLSDNHNSFMDEQGSLFRHNRAIFFGNYERVWTQLDSLNQAISARIRIEDLPAMHDFLGLIDGLFGLTTRLSQELDEKNVVLTPLCNGLSSDASDAEENLRSMATIVLSWLKWIKSDKKNIMLNQLLQAINDDKKLLHAANLCHWRTRKSVDRNDDVYNSFHMMPRYEKPLLIESNKEPGFYLMYLHQLMVFTKDAVGVRNIPSDYQYLTSRLYSLINELSIKAGNKNLVSLLFDQMNQCNLVFTDSAKARTVKVFIDQACCDKNGKLLMHFVQMVNNNEALLHLINLCHWRTKQSINDNDSIYNHYSLQPCYQNPLKIDPKKPLGFYQLYLKVFMRYLDAKMTPRNQPEVKKPTR